MKLARVSRANRMADAVIQGDDVHIIGDWRAIDCETFPLSRQSLDEIETALEASCETVKLGNVQLELPFDGRNLLICAGANYLDHVGEFRDSVPDQPALFLRHGRSLVGPGAPLRAPSVSERFDFEGELAVIIGRAGRNIARENAMDHVLGFSCLMDGSVRDFQSHSVTAGKNFTRSGTMGPWIIMRDALPPLAECALETRVSGETLQSTRADLMIFDIPALIAYCSIWTDLRPGDVISTGTPAGVGAFRKPPRWLKSGDIVEVEISGIGTLKNPVQTA